MTSARWSATRGGARFAAPWVIGFLLLYAIPIAGASLIACTTWDGLSRESLDWIGLDHFRRLFVDPTFREALWNSFAYAALNVPCQLVVALALALLVSKARRFRSLWATCYYAPHLLAGVATILIWWWLLNPQMGPINRTWNACADALGIEATAPAWLYSPSLARPSLVLMNMWYAGGPMLIFLAALLRAGRAPHEAAMLDGANRLRRFLHITLPQIAPAILFNALTLFVGSMQSFEQAFLLSNWQQQGALRFSSVYMYQSAFERHQFAYALAQGLGLLVILGAVAIGAVIVGRRFVVYEFEEAGG